ncbi:hypothetical protein [Zunongwangia sp. H14]|uniref:GapS4b family protein n=1 Tax=Zunongwangia sp. H14 TaxID=3240792 RepID=UPI003566F534
MKELYESVDKILPQGEFLRGFTNQNLVTKADLKNILKNRGVFFCNDSKENLVPFLCNTLISPQEFEQLKDSFNTKEDNPKRSTSNLEIKSNTPLIEMVPPTPEMESLKKELNSLPSNFTVTKLNPFTQEHRNQKKIFAEFEVERRDLNKSWFEATNIFKGKLVIEKESEKKIKITRQTTSPETMKVASKLESLYTNYLKNHDYSGKDSKLEKIFFGNFNNEERIAFFLRLSNSMQSGHFDFVDISDVHFRADKKKTLPKDIIWMSNKDALIFRGKKIQSDFFFSQNSFHEYIECWGMEVKLRYSYELLEGNLTVNYGFPYFEKKGKKAEFEINISSFTSQGNVPYSKKQEIREILFDLLDAEKSKVFNNFLRYSNSKI